MKQEKTEKRKCKTISLSADLKNIIPDKKEILNTTESVILFKNENK